MIKISASIAAADPLDLKNEIKRLEEACVDYIHVDVGDGNFVDDVGFNPNVVKRIRDITSLPIQVHLMTYDPNKFVEIYAKYAHELIVHVESTPHIIRVIRRIKDMGIKSGVAVLPGTAVSAVKCLIPFVDNILIITNNDSSFYGWIDREFIPEMLDKIREVRTLKESINSGMEIMVDGGINLNNVHKVIEAGASIIAMGSALFSSSNIKETVEAVKSLSLRKEPRGKTY